MTRAYRCLQHSIDLTRTDRLNANMLSCLGLITINEQWFPCLDIRDTFRHSVLVNLFMTQATFRRTTLSKWYDSFLFCCNVYVCAFILFFFLRQNVELQIGFCRPNFLFLSNIHNTQRALSHCLSSARAKHWIKQLTSHATRLPLVTSSCYLIIMWLTIDTLSILWFH